MVSKRLKKSPFHWNRLETKGDRVLQLFFWLITFLFAVVCLYPFLLMIVSSFTNESTLIREGYTLWPSRWSTDAYKAVFAGQSILDAYGITVIITVGGTLMSLVCTSMCAYAISGTQLRYRNIIAFMFYFTMLFSGGLVPTYILISRYLSLRDNLLVYILPVLVNPWNMFLMRNFFNSIPGSFRESAYLDGANDWQVLVKIIMPLSAPALATIGLFYALAYWNTWMESMLYIDNDRLVTLQFLIMRIMRNMSAARTVAQQAAILVPSPPAETIRYATAMLSIGPIILLYPFLQRYFVAGLRVGGIKG